MGITRVLQGAPIAHIILTCQHRRSCGRKNLAIVNFTFLVTLILVMTRIVTLLVMFELDYSVCSALVFSLNYRPMNSSNSRGALSLMLGVNGEELDTVSGAARHTPLAYQFKPTKILPGVDPCS